MTAKEALDKLLKAYSVYYDVETKRPAPPFAAEAAFRSVASSKRVPANRTFMLTSGQTLRAPRKYAV